MIYGIISVIKKGFIDSMFRYKIDILKALADNGYNTSRLRKDKIMSQATMQNIRQGDAIQQIEKIVNIAKQCFQEISIIDYNNYKQVA